jgi:hypothetical protein
VSSGEADCVYGWKEQEAAIGMSLRNVLSAEEALRRGCQRHHRTRASDFRIGSACVQPQAIRHACRVNPEAARICGAKDVGERRN